MKVALTANTLQTYLNAAAPAADEIAIAPTEDGGWNTLSVDAAHVLMANITLDPDNFTAHQPHEGPLWLDLDKLTDVVGLARDGGNTVELHTTKGSMVISFENITRRTNLLSDPNTNPKIPDLDHDGSAEIELKHLKTALKAADNINDHAAFNIIEHGLEVSAATKLDTVHYKIPAAHMQRHDPPEDGARAMYSLGYLFQLAKACAAGKVTLALSNDHPLRFAWETNGVTAEYLLAPRIESQ